MRGNARRPFRHARRIQKLANSATAHSSLLPDHYFIWDPTEPVATRPLAWLDGTSVAYYTHDGNKNVSEAIASNNDVAAHYEYAPFGALAFSRGGSAAANPWRFSSEYAEDDAATVYYNYRHYEPVTGRWMARDPAQEKELVAWSEMYGSILPSFNGYDYCGNSVYAATDCGGGLVQVGLAPAIVGGVAAAGWALWNLAGVLGEAVSKCITVEKECKRVRCKPCDPVAGTLLYRVDYVPPSKPHYPYQTHVHLYRVNQSGVDNGCKCYPNKNNPAVIGGDVPPPGSRPMYGTVVSGGGFEYY